MTVAFIRRRKLGKGSTNGIKWYLKSQFDRDANVNCNWLDEPPNEDIVVRWGCTSNCGPDNKFIINHAEGMHRCIDKIASRHRFIAANVNVPPTAFSKVEAISIFEINGQQWPMIGRERNHAQGRRAMICRTTEEIMLDQQSAYWSLFIPKQKEYRVYCFFGYAIAVADKVPADPNAILWNHAQDIGNRFMNMRWGRWPINVVQEALRAQHALNVEVAGIDVMEHNGIPYVLEANAAPSLTTEYRKEVFARAYEWVFRYIEENNEKPKLKEYNANGKNWKDYILPFIQDNNNE